MELLAHTATLPFILAALETNEEELQAQGIAPQTLVDVYNDFLKRQPELETIAALTANTLLQAGEVHAVRYRVKDPMHLLRKIIRKKKEYPDRLIDRHNYLDWINDLAGVRVLHLYKESWSSIGRYIQEIWELKRPPAAYISDNDTGLFVQQLKAAGCDIIRRHLGYRAVHFVIQTKPNRQRYFVEVQLRTLFEEGWSEIDHTIRYPDHMCSLFVKDLLAMLNRLTGDADDMATFTKSFSNAMQTHALKQLPWTEEERAQFRAQVEKLPLTNQEKQQLHAHLRRLLQ